MKAVNIENLKRLKRALQKAKIKRIDLYRMQVQRADEGKWLSRKREIGLTPLHLYSIQLRKVVKWYIRTATLTLTTKIRTDERPRRQVLHQQWRLFRKPLHEGAPPLLQLRWDNCRNPNSHDSRSRQCGSKELSQRIEPRDESSERWQGRYDIKRLEWTEERQENHS